MGEDIANTLLKQNSLLIERLARIETKLEVIADEHTPCRNRISNLETTSAEQASSLKSAHHRLDDLEVRVEVGIDKTGNLLWKIAGLTITALTTFAGILMWALSQ